MSEFVDTRPRGVAIPDTRISELARQDAQERDVTLAHVAVLNDMLDAAHGIICNAHQKRVDDVTTDDGASPGWAEAARRWIDAYPPTP